MSRVFTFVNAVLAGVAIAIGGTVFLALENKVIGSALFTVGLFMIVTLGLNLYTGKVCYIFEKDKEFAIGVPIIWLGNLVGTWLSATLIRMTRIAAPLVEKATTVSEAKLGDNLLSIFILAIFCNIMIYIAVENYNKNPHEVGKYVALFIGVMVFILAGFEHCIANMYYFSMAGVWSGNTFLYLLVMTAGNAVGGWIFPVAKQWQAKALAAK